MMRRVYFTSILLTCALVASCAAGPSDETINDDPKLLELRRAYIACAAEEAAQADDRVTNAVDVARVTVELCEQHRKALEDRLNEMGTTSLYADTYATATKRDLISLSAATIMKDRASRPQ